MKKSMILAVAAVACLGAGQAQAREVFFFHADLDGLQEVPPNASPGTGYIEVTFDDATNTLNVFDGAFSGLLAPTTAAHIHGIAGPGVNAPVIFGLTIPVGATSGSISGSGVLSAAQATALFDGNLYINVHTSSFPGGEIRGQLFQVPAPGALALLGVAGLVGSRRRRN